MATDGLRGYLYVPGHLIQVQHTPPFPSDFTTRAKSSAVVGWMGLFSLFRGSNKTTSILSTDIVVFIVGASGSGKSRFMSILLQSANVHVKVSRGQTPGTREVHAERCDFDGIKNSIVIVDTPSFYTDDGHDGEMVVKKWMDTNYTRSCKAAGVLYMHNLAFNPEDGNLRMSRHLGAFRRSCRRNLIPSIIHVIPTLSHGARLSNGRVRTLATQLHRQATAEGAQPGLNTSSDGIPFNEQPETAWDVVQRLLNACGIPSQT